MVGEVYKMRGSEMKTERMKNSINGNGKE